MESAPAKPKALYWWIVVLLVVSVLISYVDRSNLGVAANSLEKELGFTQSDLGLLLGAFFWTYSLLQIAAGKLIDRYNVNWVLAAGYLFWSGATALTGVVSSFWLLFGLRLLLGAGESVAYPAYAKILAANFPESLRGTANAMIDAGSKLGPAIGVFLGVRLVNTLTWRGMFIAIGGVSLLWLVPWCWMALKLRNQPNSTFDPVESPSYLELSSKRAFWGATIGLFGANYTWYILLTWLPYYFERERHFAKNELANIGSLPFLCIAISSMLCGLIADAFIRRGFAAARVRQIIVSLGLFTCCIPLFLAVILPSASASVLCLLVASVCFGLFSSNHWALSQTLAGPRAAAKWTGLQNCIGNLAGVAAANITGWILKATNSFVIAFTVAAVILIIGACGYLFVIGKTDRVRWRSEALVESPANS